MRVSGSWPERVTLRDHLGKATARPWNGDLPYGYLRLERGRARFLRKASRHVLSYGVDLVASPPLLGSATAPWAEAGYSHFQDLHLYRRSLIGSVPADQPGILEVPPDYEVLADVDDRSFDPLWRTTPLGLRESYRATLRRAVFVTRGEPTPYGFAIVGCSGVTAYLQRIAVTPSHRGRGWGGRLTLAAIRWAVRHGAATMLLNTPPANRGAAALYRSTGFHRLPDRLVVLRYPRG